MPKIHRVIDNSDNQVIENDILPNVRFFGLLVGKTGSSKTTLLVNMLASPEFPYDKIFKGENIYIFSGSLTSDEKLKKRYGKIAERRVKLAILMQHIAKEESILISEKDLTDGMLSYASQYPGQEKQIFDYFKQNPSSIENIRGPILEQKIIDHILSKVKVNNNAINVKDFKKLQENSFKSIKD